MPILNPKANFVATIFIILRLLMDGSILNYLKHASLLTEIQGPFSCTLYISGLYLSSAFYSEIVSIFTR